MAKAEGFLEIIVESDARVCVDALSCNVGVCPWTISALTAYSLELAVSFSTCFFSWVKREANQSAHVLAIPHFVFLFVVVRTISHPQFVRHGKEICCFVSLNELCI